MASFQILILRKRCRVDNMMMIYIYIFQTWKCAPVIVLFYKRHYPMSLRCLGIRWGLNEVRGKMVEPAKEGSPYHCTTVIKIHYAWTINVCLLGNTMLPRQADSKGNTVTTLEICSKVWDSVGKMLLSVYGVLRMTWSLSRVWSSYNSCADSWTETSLDVVYQ